MPVVEIVAHLANTWMYDVVHKGAGNDSASVSHFISSFDTQKQIT